MTRSLPGRYRRVARGAGASVLAMALAWPPAALAQATPATTRLPGTPAPVGTAGTPGTEASGTPGTPRPTVIPRCGPTLVDGTPAPAGAGAPATLAIPAPAPAPAALRPTAPPTRVPTATAGAPQATPSGAPVTEASGSVTPQPTRRPSLNLIQELRGLTRDLVDQLFRIDQDLVRTAGALRQAEDDLHRVTAETEALEAELARRQAAVDARTAVYATRLRALYKFTRTSPLEEILSARDFGDALRRVTMLQAITRVDNRLLGELRAERDGVLKVTLALREKQRAAAALKEQIETQQQLLVVRREEQAAAVARAQLEQSQTEAALASQQANALSGSIVAMQAQYGRELEALERQRPTTVPATATPPRTIPATPTARPTGIPTVAGTPGAGGTPTIQPTRAPVVLPANFRPLYWPVINAVVTTEYGEATFAQAFHSGIDLAQRLYAPILAVEDGIVIACGQAVPGERSLSYGMFLVLAHDRVVSTLYAHLDDETLLPPVQVGDVVKRGQVIGFIGLTGLTTGPHLHFEVRFAGQIQDPRDYLIR